MLARAACLTDAQQDQYVEPIGRCSDQARIFYSVSRLLASTRSGRSGNIRRQRPLYVDHHLDEADSFTAKLHNRMPVILARELEDAWLDPELTQAQDILDLLSRSTGLELEAYPVSRMVNKPSIDHQALIQRVG
jgi:hypothetical protein